MIKKDDLIQDPEAALAYTLTQMLPHAGADVWVVPQSGGKDSRAVAQSQLVLIKRGLLKPPKRIVYMMSDTLMEFWSFIDQARRSMHELVAIAQSLGIEAEAVIVTPIPQDDFWVRILGYGYAPPSTGMRWCTDKLKISPMAKMRGAMDIKGAPVFLGVRYGESKARDKRMVIHSCTMGGECGPDAMLNTSSISLKVSPIQLWRQCAVWDFLTMIAPAELGANNKGLVKHYGPDGDLRYGCYVCPLIYNDRTAEYLKATNPILSELIGWTNAHFREGAGAWKPENREYFLKRDARLSLRYCKELYEDLLQIGARHGLELLSRQQRTHIQLLWEWRENLPTAMQGTDIHPKLGFVTERPAAKPLHISQIKPPIATTIAITTLDDDPYHAAIKHGANVMTTLFNKREWKYRTQTGEAQRCTYWEAIPNATDPKPARAAVWPGKVSVSDLVDNREVTTELVIAQGYGNAWKQ
jgi:DNA sulfur modification protein DndC